MPTSLDDIIKELGEVIKSMQKIADDYNVDDCNSQIKSSVEVELQKLSKLCKQAIVCYTDEDKKKKSLDNLYSIRKILSLCISAYRPFKFFPNQENKDQVKQEILGLVAEFTKVPYIEFVAGYDRLVDEVNTIMAINITFAALYEPQQQRATSPAAFSKNSMRFFNQKNSETNAKPPYNVFKQLLCSLGSEKLPEQQRAQPGVEGGVEHISVSY